MQYDKALEIMKYRSIFTLSNETHKRNRMSLVEFVVVNTRVHRTKINAFHKSIFHYMKQLRE